jgi:ubiquinone/menaquinone biosynthesis C-methylase UbiE
MKIERDNVFEDVDHSGVAPELIRYLDEVAAMPEVRALHDVTSAVIAAQPGERVLDVGTGLGGAARDLARQVGPNGSVTAVDVSEAMLAAARDRHAAAADPAVDVSYERADVTDLPYDDASFDVVRVERVLQHVAAVDRACAEMARVLKPGGRLLALDTDWGSLAVDLTDTALRDRVLAHLTTRFLQPRAALALRRLLTTVGLTDVTLTAYPFLYTDLATASLPLPMLDDSIPPEANLIPREDRDAWLAALREADANGTFAAGWTAYYALARKPRQ